MVLLINRIDLDYSNNTLIFLRENGAERAWNEAVATKKENDMREHGCTYVQVIAPFLRKKYSHN